MLTTAAAGSTAPTSLTVTLSLREQLLRLGRLWQVQGRHGAAHELLAEVYNWFPEGFDTADLREARALLEELTAHGTGPWLTDKSRSCPMTQTRESLARQGLQL